MGAQIPAKDRPEQPGWPLSGNPTLMEEEAVAKAAAGELFDRGEGPFGLTEMQTWGEERTVRAVVLENLLVARHFPVHAKGVRLRGVRISGHLDLEAASLRYPLSLEYCYLDADEPVCLDYATASHVTLTGCQLAGLRGKMLTASELDLSGSTLRGPLVLVNGNIATQLVCRGAHLNGSDRDGNALAADRLKVSGDVYLDGGFTAAGTVRLAGAEIAGRLDCRGAHLNGTDSDGNALAAAGMKVGRSVYLNGEFTAEGTVQLVGAEIAGRLDCRGAHLNGHSSDADGAGDSDADGAGDSDADGAGDSDADGAGDSDADGAGDSDADGAGDSDADGAGDSDALTADGMKVGGNVNFDDVITAGGTVRLIRADITGQLFCRGAHLNGADRNGNALAAARMKVGGNMHFDGFTAAGTVRLTGADITGWLECRDAQLKCRDQPGYALYARGVRVGGDLLLRGNFTADGAVRLTGADIAGRLRCSGARLTGQDQAGNGLLADKVKVGGDVVLEGGFTADGAVRLTGAAEMLRPARHRSVCAGDQGWRRCAPRWEFHR